MSFAGRQKHVGGESRNDDRDAVPCCEAFGRGIPALAAATRVWRDVFPNNEEVYRFGFKHMKQGWANAGR
jgi:hypothetical protein